MRGSENDALANVLRGLLARRRERMDEEEELRFTRRRPQHGSERLRQQQRHRHSARRGTRERTGDRAQPQTCFLSRSSPQPNTRTHATCEPPCAICSSASSLHDSRRRRRRSQALVHPRSQAPQVAVHLGWRTSCTHRVTESVIVAADHTYRGSGCRWRSLRRGCLSRSPGCEFSCQIKDKSDKSQVTDAGS